MMGMGGNHNPHMGQVNMLNSMGGIDRQNLPNQVKKMPNPSNFKLVKCKNYEAGNFLFCVYFLINFLILITII